MELPRPNMYSMDVARQRSHEQCTALSPALFGWAHMRLRGFPRTRVEPEDIVQETWLRALSSTSGDAERLKEPERFRAWLFGIAQNVLLEELRRNRSTDRSLKTLSTSGFEFQADTATSICTGLARHETVLQFLAFAETLDELDGQLLTRCAFEDVTASDVARRLGVESGTAIKRWQRLRAHLAELRLDERLGLRA